MEIASQAEAFLPGTLVRARGRDWIVLPPDEAGVVRLRPVTGGEDDLAGVFVPLEPGAVTVSQFEPPHPSQAGDSTGASLLRDAVRLSLRSGAGPFRSLARLSVQPRPYQFVPLIMALRLDPIRMLIADDVGVGKTIEAAMVARELLDRGLARRLAVICPAHLCDQWQAELKDKFNLDAAVVQPSKIARLERHLPRSDISIYQYYPYLVVSIDFIKSDRNRRPFLDNAPDLIIVDEAHIASRPRGTTARVQHQRHEFLQELAGDPSRHIILVTATPHSGIEESFRSLLGLIDPSFDVPEDQDLERRRLLPHIVQRKRKELEHWLDTDTPFPERDPAEVTYSLSEGYHSLFDDVLTYCRESVAAVGTTGRQQRVRHWAAIALLRCILSSPDAAVSVLEKRRKRKEEQQQGQTLEEIQTDVDALYGSQVFDSLGEETAGDYVPAAPMEDAEPYLTDSERRRLSGFLRRASELCGPTGDRKLVKAAEQVSGLLRDGFRPIVYCRFIATAKYVAAWLEKLLGSEFRSLRVIAVTGEDGDEKRRAQVDELAQEPVRVLVATDCLSEGINLQEHFDAVLHYDLPWNPNRLEQREGRVDRYGQKKKVVKTVLLYGSDNPVDLVVLDVLIRKARTIRERLGISVPVPVESEAVVQAVVDSVLLRGMGRETQLQLDLEDPEVSRFHAEWEAAADREEKHRAFFAQHGIKPDEVARELQELSPVLGDATVIKGLVANAAQRFGGRLAGTKRPNVFQLHPGELERALRSRAPDIDFPLEVAFDTPAPEGVVCLGRNHPVVLAYCDAFIGAALSPEPDEKFARCGAIYTDAVDIRTGLLLLRLRYMLREESDQFAEEVVVAAFRRHDGRLTWLEPLDSAAQRLLEAKPTANMPPQERQAHVAWALELLKGQDDWFAPVVESRVERLQESHNRLRRVVKKARLKVQPHVPPDILGCYVLVPTGGR